MLIELDDAIRLELAAMAYKRWDLAYDALKNAKCLTWETSGKFCLKGEWPLFRASILAKAEKELATATALKNAICKYSPIIN
jgi:hypothetical protein